MNDIEPPAQEMRPERSGERGKLEAIASVARATPREPRDHSRAADVPHHDLIRGRLAATLEQSDLEVRPQDAEEVGYEALVTTAGLPDGRTNERHSHRCRRLHRMALGHRSDRGTALGAT